MEEGIYHISKEREFDGQSFKKWVYTAVSHMASNSQYSLSDLAKSLSSEQDIESARLEPSTFTPPLKPNVQLAKGRFIQRGIINDEELGNLAVLILQHKSKRK